MNRQCVSLWPAAPHALRLRMAGRRHVVRGALAAACLAAPATTSAHEIPKRVTVVVLAKADGNRLRVVVRAPLAAMRDVEFPLRGAGYLDFGRLGSTPRDAAQLWIADQLGFLENGDPIGSGRVLSARVSLPSERLDVFDAALAHVTGPSLDPATELVPGQALLDVALEYSVQSSESRFTLQSSLARLGQETIVAIRFILPTGAERAFTLGGGEAAVHLDPRWHQAAWHFLKLGIAHILDGIDHLLFVLCLVIPFRRLRSLVAIVTSFTVAHSITLIAAASGMGPRALWFPPLIEVLIAASIVFMAVENIVGPALGRRWIVAFAFGLVHGFGFAFALRETLQFAGGHLATSLVAFNVGVEVGQVAVVLLFVPVLEFAFTRVVRERVGTILLSAFIAHTAWHWMTERFEAFRRYEVAWSEMLPSAGPARMVLWLAIATAAMWGFLAIRRRLATAPPVQPPVHT